MVDQDEHFDIVDDEGRVIGLASRAECHGDPELIHRTTHVVIYHPDGRILLQKRSGLKDIQPGKWDTAVGGHLNSGEDYETAARREMQEELGIPGNLPLRHLFDNRIRNEIESENVRVYATVYAGPFTFPGEEIDEIRFWHSRELCGNMWRDDFFTPNLIEELNKLLICSK